MFVRAMTSADISGVVALQKSCFPYPFPDDLLWKSDHLEIHLKVFNEGQLVAASDEDIIGSASALRISHQNWEAHQSWELTTGGLYLTHHDPEGDTLYAVDISVHPGHRGKGIGRALYFARFEIVKNLGLRRLGTACRIPGYSAAYEKEGISPAEYIREAEQNLRFDTTLSVLLRYGMKPIGVIENYMEDLESGGCAALLEWKP